jgi:hypothetical protein
MCMHANIERIKNDLFTQYIAIKSICRSSHMRIINFYYYYYYYYYWVFVFQRTCIENFFFILELLKIIGLFFFNIYLQRNCILDNMFFDFWFFCLIHYLTGLNFSNKNSLKNRLFIAIVSYQSDSLFWANS